MALFLRGALFCCQFFVVSVVGFSQGKIDYTLNVSQFSQSAEDGTILHVSRPLKFNWTVTPTNFGNNNDIPGRLVIVVSPDSVLSDDDQVMLDSACTLPQFSYAEKSVRHQLAPGNYFLFTTYYARDEKYAGQSNTVRTQLRLFDVRLHVTEARFSDLKVSEYSRERRVHLKIEAQLSCCEKELGTLSSQWDVGVLKDANSEPVTVHSFYRTDTLSELTKELILEESLWNNMDFTEYNFVRVLLRSAYFSNGYREIPDTSMILPLKVVRDVDESNELRRNQYPFLTYGNFELSDAETSAIDVERSMEQAESFYGLVENALKSTIERLPKDAIMWADSAFSLAGTNRVASVLFAEPSVVADLYSGLFKWMDSHSLFSGDDQANLNFRLGEAMKMEELIKRGYSELVRKILPDSLDMVNEVEAGGFFDEQDVFRNTNITELPVLWRKRTVPALEHFVRVVDYESADRIVTNVQQHVDLVSPLWRIILSDTILTNHFAYLAASLSESNEMLDFALQRLRYYSEVGMFREGLGAVDEASMAFQCGYQFAPVDFWKSAGLFYESFGSMARADSLYRLCDSYVEKEMGERRFNHEVLKLKSNNALLLKAKLSGEGNRAVGESMTRSLQQVQKDENMLFTYLDLLADQEIGRKLGFFESEIYPGFYLNQLKQLDAQNSFFLSNEWMTDLAFFLGRDGKLEEAISVYMQLFPIRNLKALAFRLGFSEESQVYYSEKSQQTVSRYLNVVEEYKAKGQTDKVASAIELGLQQTLFHHSFILRGNYRLLYDVYRSEDPQVQRLYVLWQSLREYLNKLYVEDEPDREGLQKIRNQIIQTEKRLIRLARDTTSMVFDYIPAVDSIRKYLNPGEAAIEIVRYYENHRVYYGQQVKYAAFIVRDQGPVQLLPLSTHGEHLEGRNFKYYRNAVQLRIKDELSYDAYWKLIGETLTGVTKIYFAPDGVYHLINPNTFYNPASGKYLVDEIEIQTVPTITMLKKGNATQLKSLTIVGNPLYNKENVTQKKEDTIRSSREYFTSNPIVQLPGTKVEAEIVASLFKSSGSSVKLLTGVQATKQNLFEFNNADVIHLATHGFWIDKPQSTSAFHNLFETMSSSGVVLADAQRNEKGKFILQSQGILTSAEVQDMNLFNTDLVVLSACETGLGEVVPGEGLYGLKRALQRSGVRQMVTSLWKVDDEATMRFMRTFYESLIESADASKAFRYAMTTQKQQFADPYFWGAFVLTTN